MILLSKIFDYVILLLLNIPNKRIYFFKIDNNHSPYNKNDNRLIFKIFSIEIGKTILLN